MSPTPRLIDDVNDPAEDNVNLNGGSLNCDSVWDAVRLNVNAIESLSIIQQMV
jgi:hypothetical protein